MNNFFDWFKKVLATVYNDEGLLGIAILLLFLLLTLWWLGVDGAEIISCLGG